MTRQTNNASVRSGARALLEALRAGDDLRAAAALGAWVRRGAESLPHLCALVDPLKPRARAAFLHSILTALAGVPDPDQALTNLRRFAEARFGVDEVAQAATLPAPALMLLLRLFGTSQFLAGLLVRYPEHLDWLAADPELGMPRTVKEFLAQLDEAVADVAGGAPRRAAAIRAMRRELLRLVARRLTNLGDEMEMARELSDLAEATLQHALDEVTPPLTARFGWPMEELGDDASSASERRAVFAVIAMGKLGGRELNFSSDIDLIFIYSDEGETSGLAGGVGRISNHAFFTRLAEALTAYLMDPSDEGYFYRVDTRLRPDGETGPLARSLGSCEIYYTTQARLWERLALLKARAVAGEGRLGHAFESMIRPLVFDPLHSHELILEIADLKQRIDHEIGRKAGAEREIKRGAGGIRELEFLVQTLQMLHGARNTRLWTGATLEALRQLGLAHLLPPEQVRQMSEDYLFLRTIEHRLQMTELRQTHMMPEEGEALDVLAVACGIGGNAECGMRNAECGIKITGSADALVRSSSPGEQLMRRWGEISARVHHDFTEFFERSQRDAAVVEDRMQEVFIGSSIPHSAFRIPHSGDAGKDTGATSAAALILSAAPESAVLPQLAPWGIGGGSLKVLRRLGGMGRTMYLTTEGRLAYRQLLPVILRLLESNPRPEVALSNLESYLYASGAIAGYYTTFVSNPRVFELLMLAFGSGSALAQTMIAHPEFLDIIADSQVFAAPGGRVGEMRRLLGRWSRGGAGDPAHFSAALARVRRLEFMLAALGELAGLLDYAASCAWLGAAAEVIAQAALERAAGELGLIWPLTGFAVAALGKLGAGELNYYSDLDLLFVWDEGFAPGHAAPGEAAATLAHRLIELLTAPTKEGAPFAVDARLRPEGQNAPLAPPLARYVDYYAGGRAQLWEFQSAMKLRPLAGDLELGARLSRRLGEVIAEKVRGAALGPEIHAMRRRMEAALKLPRWVHCDFKAGAGGTVDLEFIAQYLQLRFLADDPGLMGLGPLQAFVRLEKSGRLASQLAVQMSADYVWMRRLERRARLLFESEKSLLPASGEKLEALERAAAALTAEAGESTLPEAVDKVRRRNRRHFDEIVLP